MQDHVFDPEVWRKSKPAAEFGPDITFREYSILDNPRMSPVRACCRVASPCCFSLCVRQAVLESVVLVDVCTSGKPCGKAAEAGMLVMNLTTAITDADAKAIFSPLSSIKILRFSSMLDVFAGFAVDADKDRFYRRVKDYAGIWCCIHAHPVRAVVRFAAACAADRFGGAQGHIWYDLLFDKVHVDRHNRHFNGTFPLLTGP